MFSVVLFIDTWVNFSIYIFLGNISIELRSIIRRDLVLFYNSNSSQDKDVLYKHFRTKVCYILQVGDELLDSEKLKLSKFLFDHRSKFQMAKCSAKFYQIWEKVQNLARESYLFSWTKKRGSTGRPIKNFDDSSERSRKKSWRTTREGKFKEPNLCGSNDFGHY